MGEVRWLGRVGINSGMGRLSGVRKLGGEGRLSGVKRLGGVGRLDGVRWLVKW